MSDYEDNIYTEDIERLIKERDDAIKERDQLARALSVRTKERDAAVSSANRLQAIVTSEALERYPPR